MPIAGLMHGIPSQPTINTMVGSRPFAAADPHIHYKKSVFDH
jgi:hypothetical protein